MFLINYETNSTSFNKGCDKNLNYLIFKYAFLFTNNIISKIETMFGASISIS